MLVNILFSAQIKEGCKAFHKSNELPLFKLLLKITILSLCSQVLLSPDCNSASSEHSQNAAEVVATRCHCYPVAIKKKLCRIKGSTSFRVTGGVDPVMPPEKGSINIWENLHSLSLCFGRRAGPKFASPALQGLKRAPTCNSEENEDQRIGNNLPVCLGSLLVVGSWLLHFLV